MRVLRWVVMVVRVRVMVPVPCPRPRRWGLRSSLPIRRAAVAVRARVRR